MTTHTIKRNDEVIGWVHEGGCSNAHCKRSIREGRVYHAITAPRAGIDATLEDNHFSTLDEADAAIRSAMHGIPGRF